MMLNFKKALVALVGILMLGGFLRLYKLDNMSLKADEYIGVNISQGYKKSGEWKFWNWNEDRLTESEYTRGKIYYWQSAQVLKFLPPTEFNFRLISVFWGIAGIGLMFLVAYYYSKSLAIALLSSFLWSISISAITFDRHFRMYSMFAPVYLGLSVFVFQFLETLPRKNKNWIEKISNNFQLNFYHLLPALFLLGVSFLSHFLTINIFPVVAIYILFFFFYEWKINKNLKSKYFWLLLLPLFSIVFLSLFGYVERASEFLGFMENNFGHYKNIMADYSHHLLAITFFVVGAFCLVKNNLRSGIWLVLSFLVPFLLAVFVWDRSSGPQYIYFIQTFKTIVVASGIVFLAQKITEIFSQKKWCEIFRKTSYKKNFIFVFFIFYFVTLLYNFNFWEQKDSFYQEKRRWSHSNYKEVLNYYVRHREENAILVTRDFRNYYYANSNTKVFDFGGEHQPEKKLTIEKLQAIEKLNIPIWIVINVNDYDYISGDARDYIKENYTFIETTFTNSSMEIWKK